MTTKSYLNNGEEVEIEFYYQKGFTPRSPLEPDDDPEINIVSVVQTSNNTEMVHKITTKEYDTLLDECWRVWRERE